MPFPFTFKISVPGLSNPFTAQSVSAAPLDRSRNLGRPHRRPSPTASLPPAAFLSRKRAWVPSVPEASCSTSTFTSTASGYLAPPSAKWHMVPNRNRDESQRTVEAISAELPPAKRRRTFAGSVVSAALNAAVVGTAVGLTVYRLWRNRGKEIESLPPPPYDQGEWTPEAPRQQHTIQAIQAPPATPRSRKTRQSHTPTPSKRLNTRRRPHIRAHAYTPPPCSSPALLSAPQPEFDFGHHNCEDEIPVEDQMDWIGDKLTMLIEEGKKALGREVVVMSDAREDEVDDGMGGWEEEPSTSISRSGSLRRAKKPRNILPPSSCPTPPLASSPRMAGFSYSQSSHSAGIPITPPRTTRAVSVDSHSSYREDETAWESPELRESMEKARARFLKNRAT